jgi:hypothetical protein
VAVEAPEPQQPFTKVEIPEHLKDRMGRGKAAMRKGAPKRNECLAHARGEQYKYVDSDGALQSQAINTISSRSGEGKPRHRVRQTRNFIFDITESEVAATAQRIPSYEVSPSGTEPRRISAARLSRRVALYGYDKWKIRGARERVIRYSIVADEGFAWPYFDNSIGPYISDVDKEGKPYTIGQGDICIRTFGPNEVYWEAGLKFDESPWHAIEQARDLQSVYETEGYLGGKLDPDGQKAETEVANNTSQEKLVLVTEYLERPSKANPEGAWITMANDRVIIAQRPYPCQDPEGHILDEPVLHKLTYAMDPENDRDSGLVRHLIDAQRTVNHCNNKISEWINLALNPQLIIQNGQLKQKLNDEPGAVYNAVGTGELKWREVPEIPVQLFQQKSEAVADMGRIAGQFDTTGIESGKGLQAAAEQEAGRRANFLYNLSEFDSRLMRHCLYLVQKHYTEPRLLKVRGDAGTEPIKDFLGSELLGEMDVRVDPASLETRTQAAVEAKIFAFAERGWVSPHAAMAAINNGTAESLVEGYERDVARANLIIQKVKEGPEVLFSTPARRPFYGEEPGTEERQNPETGKVEEVEREFIPGWMPRPFDDEAVELDVIADFMKSPDYDDLDPPSQEALNAYYDALLQQKAKKQAQQAQAQAETAESLGMSNAARPQGTPPPLPDQKPIEPQA